MLALAHRTAAPVTFTIEVDRAGNDSWRTLRTITVPAASSVFHSFAATEAGAWIRLRADRAASDVTAHFQYRNRDSRGTALPPWCDGLTRAGAPAAIGGVMRSLGRNRRTLGLVAVDRRDGRRRGYYELDERLELRRSEESGGERRCSPRRRPRAWWKVDAGSVILVQDGQRFRIPADSDYHEPAAPPALESVAC